MNGLMNIQQVIGAPKHDRKAIRRYILRRWLEKDRQKILALITSKSTADWLRASSLPGNIEITDMPSGWKPTRETLAPYANDLSIWALIVI
jgi:hypothetical protein